MGFFVASLARLECREPYRRLDECLTQAIYNYECKIIERREYTRFAIGHNGYTVNRREIAKSQIYKPLISFRCCETRQYTQRLDARLRNAHPSYCDYRLFRKHLVSVLINLITQRLNN